MNYENFIKIKEKAGLHSPSIFELRNGGLEIDVDACFLHNPYAFDLFLNKIKGIDLTNYIKYYPPQNNVLSAILSQYIGIDSSNILLGNGAIQIIELLMRYFRGEKKCIITPTFSTYYEYDISNCLFFRTKKEENFFIDQKKLISFIRENNINILVIVNPNNPTGTVLSKQDILYLKEHLKDVIFIIDESFIDFYDKDQSLLYENNENIIIIKSLSKDFGVAGLRLGYMKASVDIIKDFIYKFGLCWNINGIGQLFLENLSSIKKDYEKARIQYLECRDSLLDNLKKLNKVKVYNSHGNFILMDCFEQVEKIFSYLLFEKKIYTRILNDKIHLDKTFLRVACGTKEDNDLIEKALREYE